MYANIYQLISSLSTIDIEKFKDYGERTARRFAELYPWYYMPASLHELFIHGWRIMGKLELPIGYYSEEAQESNNKNIKRTRLYFSRKSKR